MKEFSTLEKLAMQSARMTDNGDWNDADEMDALEQLKAQAKQEGHTDKAIDRAIKVTSQLYVKHYLD